jgi:hypothetical protein
VQVSAPVRHLSTFSSFLYHFSTFSSVFGAEKVLGVLNEAARSVPIGSVQCLTNSLQSQFSINLPKARNDLISIWMYGNVTFSLGHFNCYLCLKCLTHKGSQHLFSIYQHFRCTVPVLSH